ncbi:hypothetical protein FIV06_09140 [Labrenzia sp. THAF191b]|uniref:hypothetical protein n=1 Tax=unclassified Labrenzia TaxID=2648686 RepID=UPI001268E82B|nr:MULTISPECIES: hypothetical protein [unclassified Labrenzia]QFS97585.1 hypothetical protein FIV06_09140 [Labrenzia sp. THAF191b]QFT03900.1 hypothetical protein FIV05_09140 [Labrenzia sp. THAF191a]QFT15442.1 hypothetical protein FIV03_09145 [Labrenzia sp. THAF187b]
MGTFKATAERYVFEVTKDFPDSLPLKDRIARLDAERPALKSAPAAARKAWQSARRTYLQRFGYEKPALRKVETPLEIAISNAQGGCDVQ